MKIFTKCCILLSICLVSHFGNAQLDRQWLNNYSTSDTAYMNVIGLFDAGNGNVLKASLITKYSPPETYNRLLLQKVAPDGSTIWEETYTHPQYQQFHLYKGGIDENGNTYFSGQLTFNQSEAGWFVISFDDQGQERWQKGIVDNQYTFGASQFCVTDNAGNTYASGYVGDGAGSSFGAIVKYDQAGTEQWVHYDPTNYNYGADMIIANNSDLIACDGQFELTRFSPTGTVVWNTPDTADFVYVSPKIAEAADGSIYAISFLNYSYSFKKLNANGVFQWNETEFAQNLVFGDNSVGLHTDNQSNIYLTGINSTEQNDYQTAIFKYNPQGAEMWNQEFTTETYDITDILLLDNNQIAAAAMEYNGGPYYTKVYLLNQQNGAILDQDSLADAGTQHHLLHNEAGLYLAGTGDFETALARYGGTLAIENESLSDNVLVYPNPFVDELTILSSLDGTLFECSDLSGKVISAGNLDTKTTIQLGNLAPGVYNLTVKTSGGDSVTKRIIKVN